MGRRRAILGIGAGWFELEHRQLGFEFGTLTERFARSSATDMTSGNAMRFRSHISGCSAHGEITSAVTVAEVVAASAAFPVLLPALRRDYDFPRPRDWGRSNATITYGYDELGRRTSTDISGTSSSVALDAAGRVTGETNALGANGDLDADFGFAGCVGRAYGMLWSGGWR